MTETAVEVAGLFIYPVKSMRGIRLDSAKLTHSGLVADTGLKDREWMVVDQRGRFFTQRQQPKMATVEPSIQRDHLLLEGEGLPSLALPLKPSQHAELREVKVWNDQLLAQDEGDGAARWLDEVFGMTGLRLVRALSGEQRQVKEKYLQADEVAGNRFADGFPYLIANMASLASYNSELEAHGIATVRMQRFRPNVIIKGVDAFMENQLSELRHADYTLAPRKPCQRCSMINVNQASGVQINGNEPFTRLREMQTLNDKSGAYFGQNAILCRGEHSTIQVGDPLSALLS